jgi:CRISPR-associated protein Cmr2
MTEKVSLHVEFGPVQPFIAEARRTRDLWAGSYILSYLMAHALCAACKAGVVLKQPAVDNDELFRAVQAWREHKSLPLLETARRIGSLPDRFEGEAQDVQHAAAIAEAAISAWFDTWLRLADHTWSYLEQHGWPANRETRRLWNEQIGTHSQRAFWTPRWTVGPYDVHRYRRWSFYAFNGLADQLGEKSTLGGERTALHAGQTCRQDVRHFWARTSEQLGSYDIRLGGAERLDAINLVKRLFPKIAADALGWHVQISYPSTRTIAVAPWLAAILKHPDDDLALLLCEVVAALQSANVPEPNRFSAHPQLRALAVGHTFASEAQQLLDYDGEVFFPESDEAWADFGPPEQATRLASLRTMVRALRERASELALDPPSSFFAILVMDGDRLGDLVSSAPDVQKNLSEALGTFSRHVPTIIEASDILGQTIYAGGDDILALVPVDTALIAAERLAQTYREHLTELASAHGASASISAAIVYANVSAPLQVLLQRARSLLDDIAKEQLGRDAFAVEVWKSSGPIVMTGRPWQWQVEGAAPGPSRSTSVSEILWASEQLRTGFFSNRLFYKIQPLAAVIDTTPNALTPAQQEEIIWAEHLNNRDRVTDADMQAEWDCVRQLVALLRWRTNARTPDRRLGRLDWQMARFVRFLTEQEA